jgi:hypothetical protein
LIKAFEIVTLGNQLDNKDIIEGFVFLYFNPINTTIPMLLLLAVSLKMNDWELIIILKNKYENLR